MERKKTNYLIFFIILAFIAGWSILIYSVGVRNIVSVLGVENSYLLAFLLAVFGGMSSFTAAPFFVAIATFAAAGINIFLLGVIAGLGLTISDSIYYYLGGKGRYLLSEKWRTRIGRLAQWLRGKPAWVVPFVIYGYTGLTPFPNDILMISLALINYPYKKLVLFLVLGDVTSTILFAYLSKIGVDLFF